MSRFARVRVDIITQQGEAGLQRLERASEEAAQSMRQLDQQVEQVEASQKKLNMTAGQTANALRRTGRSSRSMGRMLGQAGQASGALSGTMTTLVPQLGGAAMILGEASSAAEMFAGAGASVLRVLGPVAIAVVAAGAAYAYFNKQLKEAEERQDRMAEKAENASARAGVRTDFAQDLADREAILSGDADADDVALLRRFEEIRDEQFGDEIADAQANLARLREEGLEYSDSYKRAEEQLSGLQDKAFELAETEQRITKEEQRQAEIMQEQINLENQRAQAAARRFAAEEKERAAAEAYSARVALSRLSNDPTALGTVGIGIDLSDPTPNRDRDRADLRSRLQANRRRLDERIGAGALNVAGADELATEQQTGRGAAIAGAAASFASGDALGMLGMIGGPGGAIASSAVAGLSALGEQGAEGVVEAIKEQTRSLVAGIGELPDLISEIPELLAEMLPELIGAIVELPTLIVIGVVEALASLGQMIVEGLRDALRGGDETRSGAALRLATQNDSRGDRAGVAAALFVATADRNHNGLTVSDQEVGSILQVGEVVTARGDMMPQSAAVHGARGRTSGGAGATQVVYNGPVLSDPLSSWHDGMDSRFGANGWDRKPNYTGGGL